MHTTLFAFEVEIDAARLDLDEPTLRARIDEYRDGDRLTFDAEVAFPDGLTGDVMRAMLAIPPGQTRSYGAVADDLGTAAVAVGQACGSNPVPIVVPCHRIVGADGLGGFSAAGGGRAGRTLKRRLLEHEAAVVARRDGVEWSAAPSDEDPRDAVPGRDGAAPTVQTRLD